MDPVHPARIAFGGKGGDESKEFDTVHIKRSMYTMGAQYARNVIWENKNARRRFRVPKAPWDRPTRLWRAKGLGQKPERCYTSGARVDLTRKRTNTTPKSNSVTT
eukprot:990678-Prorocentrum_minimum.AAC.4